MSKKGEKKEERKNAADPRAPSPSDAGADCGPAMFGPKMEDRTLARNGYAYDYAMRFLVNPVEKRAAGDEKNPFRPGAMRMIHNMLKHGLVLKSMAAKDEGSVFVKIHIPLHVLEKTADSEDFHMELDPVAARRVAEAGEMDDEKGIWHIRPIELNKNPEKCRYPAYEHTFGPYDTEERHKDLFKHKLTTALGSQHPFDSAKRLKILNIVLTSAEYCKFDLERRVRLCETDDCGMAAHFAIHNPKKLKRLEANWVQWCRMPWREEPFEEVRDYFGEQVTMYFAFLNHYTTWLAIPMVFGLGVQFNVIGESSTQATTVPLFIVLLSFWCVLMLEFWKRRQAELAMFWGMTDFEEREQQRASYEGEKVKSPVDGSDIVHYPRYKKYSWLAVTYTTVAAVILLVIACVASIMALRWVLLVEGTLRTPAPYIASTINAVFILVANYFYGKLARALNELENHRTDTEYVDQLILKEFAFQFVNSYSSFFYLAFLQYYLEGSCDGTGSPEEGEDERDAQRVCTNALAINMAIIFATNLTAGNLMEVVYPLVTAQYKMDKILDELDEHEQRDMSLIEFQGLLEPYDRLLGVMEDYLELAVQFGYITLFASAFPAAPFLAFVSNFFEQRFDALKLCKVFQRPMPRGAQDIGTWQTIFEILSVIAVVTNAAIMCFSFASVLTVEWTDDGRVWTFIMFQYTVLTCMFAFAKIVPDVAPHVSVAQQRNDFIVSKILRHEPDEHEHSHEVVNDEDTKDAEYKIICGTENPGDDQFISHYNIRELLPLGDRKKYRNDERYNQGKKLAHARKYSQADPYDVVEDDDDEYKAHEDPADLTRVRDHDSIEAETNRV